MSPLSLHRVASRIVAISSLVLVSGLGAGQAVNAAPAGNDAECVSAAITDIALEQLANVDEIRVRLAAFSPAHATSLVTVETEESDRIIEMSNQGYKSIHFAPGMRSNEFRISLFPGSMDRAPACIESVELLSAGGSVVVFKP